MIALLQRVRKAHVEVAGETVGAIDQGLLVLFGVERGDDDSKVQRLAERVVCYRIFSDSDDKMNLSLRDVGGSVLVVSQFTLAADTRKGLRPSFSDAADPETGERLYLAFVAALAVLGVTVATGRFRADMQVHLINDGPVTLTLRQ
ncbi:MAG: D-tyrosyl-tRNA(Tyr) deacylase [Gammaproteobacteria bacterium]|nr:D-tyrosyl-tRNA(Tyr) deacylase [Gammaproteobacteria bacterium]